jgi:hypothetical protein
MEPNGQLDIPISLPTGKNPPWYALAAKREILADSRNLTNLFSFKIYFL